MPNHNMDIYSEEERQTRVKLASAYRLAAIKGWDDGIYTHITSCIPNQKDVYLINKFGLRFDEITPENLVKVNLSGEILSGNGPVNQSGFAIHGAVHAARPDAFCVLHLHVDSVIAVASKEDGLLPLSQHALRFYNDIASHPYQGLALSASEQNELIAALGNKKALLLQNHGCIICGVSIEQAFYLMDVLDKACKIQLLAGGHRGLILPKQSVCELAHKQLCADGDKEGLTEWPAYQRLLISH